MCSKSKKQKFTTILSLKMLDRDEIKYLFVFLFVVAHAHIHLRENKG